MEVQQDDTVTRSRRRWWHRGPFVRREVRLSVGTLFVFLFVFYVALPLLASHRAEVNSLAHINIGYLVLGVLLEIGALVAYTQLTHAVLPSGGPRRLRLFRINLSTLALSHVSPGGTAPGAALGYRLLTQSGVSGPDAGFALGTQGIGSAVVLNVMFWCSLVAFLVTHGFHAPASHSGGQSQSASILVIVAAGVGVILLGAFGGLFYLLTRGQHQASRVIRRVAGRIRFLDADRTTALVEQLAERFAGPHGEPVPDPAGGGMGRGQLAARRGLAVGVRGRLQPLRLPRRPADGLRAGQHLWLPSRSPRAASAWSSSSWFR